MPVQANVTGCCLFAFLLEVGFMEVLSSLWTSTRKPRNSYYWHSDPFYHRSSTDLAMLIDCLY